MYRLLHFLMQHGIEYFMKLERFGTWHRPVTLSLHRLSQYGNPIGEDKSIGNPLHKISNVDIDL